MNARFPVLVVGAAGLALLGYLMFGPGAGDASAPLPGVQMEATAPTEPPPEFGPEATDAERIAAQLRILTTGDDEDAEWARGELVAGGEPARAALTEALRHAVGANTPLLEHGLDVLLARPQPSDVPVAREALASRDPQAVIRGAVLLGRVGAPAAAVAVEDLADAAIRMEHPVASYVMDALARIGGEGASAAVRRAADGMDDAFDGFAFAALSRIGRREDVDWLRERFERETEPRLRLAAAAALLDLGDRSGVEWLRGELDEGVGRSEPALQVLAAAGDPEAFERIAQRLRSALEREDRRAAAVALLASQPLDRTRDLLREAAGEEYPFEVRLEALDLLVRKQDDGAFDRVLRMLHAPGPDGRSERRLAALVLGRVRREEAGPALAAAYRAAGDDLEMRGLLLRAIVFSSSVDQAELVVRAMAADQANYLEQDSVAFWVASVLGHASAAFREAVGRHLVEALEGAYGTPRQSGLVHLVSAARACPAPGAAAAIEPYLTHEHRFVRETAAETLGLVPGPDTERALRAAWWEQQDAVTRRAIALALERVHWRTRR